MEGINLLQKRNLPRSLGGLGEYLIYKVATVVVVVLVANTFLGKDVFLAQFSLSPTKLHSSMDTTPTPAPKVTIEQYKAYIQDLGNIGTRYTTSNAFYLSVITALLGILSLTEAGSRPCRFTRHSPTCRPYLRNWAVLRLAQDSGVLSQPFQSEVRGS